MRLRGDVKSIARRLKWFAAARGGKHSSPAPAHKAALCDRCARSFLRAHTFRYIDFHRNTCSFCGLLYESIRAFIASRSAHIHRKNIEKVSIRKGLKHQLDVVIEGADRSPSIIQSSLRQHLYDRQSFKGTFQLQELLADSTPSLRQIFKHDQSIIDWSEVRRWMSSCASLHGSDCSSLARHTLIQRSSKLVLIDVHDLCLTLPSANAQFVALSYVWGGAQQLRLSEKNRAHLFQRRGLAAPDYIKKITATVWDAIEVVKEIGLRFLWVDALCIQQDSKIDSAYQISNMHNIFGSAYLTIVAAQGDSAEAGLRGTSSTPRPGRPDLEIVKYKHKPLIREVGSGLFGLVAHKRNLLQRIQGIDVKPIFSSCTDIQGTRWNSRAWTMQEGLLSDRALVFIDDQVFWHCSKAVWCEAQPDREKDENGLAVDARYLPLRNITSHPHFEQKLRSHEHSTQHQRPQKLKMTSAYKLYKDMVESYSRRNMGNLADKLAAFDGISNILEQCLQTRLIYGLPEALLDIALLWQPVDTLKRIHGVELPSWSWAGWQGAVEYQYQRATPNSDLHRSQIIGKMEERVTPLLRWYKATSSGGFKLRDEAFHAYNADPDQKTRSHADRRGYFRRHESFTSDTSSTNVPPFLLRTYTTQTQLTVHKPHDAWFSAEAVHDSEHDKLGFHRIPNYFCVYSPRNPNLVIGELVFDDVHDAASLLRHQHQIEFIALSKTQVFRSHRMNHEPRGNMYERPLDYSLYNVMAIRKHPNMDAVARIGLGRIFQDEWHLARPRESWVSIC